MHITPSDELRCPECRADWSGGLTCVDYFDQLLYWEYEDLPARGRVHHLTVLCYHLQHPSLYSTQAFHSGLRMLVDFLEGGASPQQIRILSGPDLASDRRTWKVQGSEETQGAYLHPVHWKRLVTDVIAAGADHYVESVNAWANAILQDVRSSGNGSMIPPETM